MADLEGLSENRQYSLSARSRLIEENELKPRSANLDSLEPAEISMFWGLMSACHLPLSDYAGKR
jgi:hypothetical protein